MLRQKMGGRGKEKPFYLEDVRFPNSHKRVGKPDWMVYGVALVNSDSMTEFIYCHNSKMPALTR